MNKSKIIFPILGVLTLASAITYTTIYDLTHSQADVLMVGDKVSNEYNLDLKDQQEKWNIDSCLGKVTIINFWGTWCSSCIEEMPYFNEVKLTYSDQINVYAFADNSSTDYERYVDKKWSDYQVIFGMDNDDKFYAYCGGDGNYPHTVIVDKDGIAIYNQAGSVTVDLLTSYIVNAS